MRRRRRPAGDDAVRYAPRPAAPDAAPPAADAAGAPLPSAVTRSLGALYAAPPGDAPYWDGLEARIMAAVRGSAATTGAVTGAVAGAVTGAMRAVPAAAAQWSTAWWQLLARWTRPALAAAGVTLVAAGGAVLHARATADATRARSAYRAVLGDPYDPAVLPVPSHDPQLARAADAFEAEPGDAAGAADARAARVAAELLSGGLVRRAPLDPRPTGRRDRPAVHGRAAGRGPVALDHQARREATFRYVMPD